MGRIVYQQLDALVVTADATQDVWSIIAVSPNNIKLHAFELTSNAIAAAIINLDLRRITAAGTGGSASTTEELADDVQNTAHTATVRTLDLTTEGADGGGLMGFQWEQLGPVGHVYTPDMRPFAGLTDGFALSWHTAGGATVSGYICWEEL